MILNSQTLITLESIVKDYGTYPRALYKFWGLLHIRW